MKTKILAELRRASGYVSGQALCEEFHVSRTAIWKAINTLKKEGYEIEAVQNKGYRLVRVPEILSQKELESIRQTKWLASEYYYLDETESTNMVAKKLAEEGAAHGTVVVAGRQTAGKGRRGRVWETPPKTSISMTYVLKPDMMPGNASMLTLVMAMAVVRGIESLTGLEAKIKWPNDVVINGKKVCGILTEMSAQMDYINHIVVGTGINVLNEEFSDELKDKATSIYLETGKSVQRAGLIEAINRQFEHYYEIFMETQDMSVLAKEYNTLLVNLGGQVRVEGGKEPYVGNSRGITQRGELIVDTWEARRLVSSGEVSVRGVYGYV
ncbi:biotin--[acetyl-CoA-carboxylase] ligase [Eubacterium oxidoreducens]|uniref:Bifunctional ligase/repressor BirA n=1 Tax=Eubacterium oxidoreducens TaxID=1732 RepID=A0A1G6A046_EUBOX|nr:biotin--[acetyl-CoA-carboxylase] ligase [Eubacterium oxidoreducens]SDB01814.1 BirA family transcriptional regulator, biotin operon repressor / biotin-[acetyl-CoA-carboxylase] ligase [Eubacterium oxidoreducens]